METDSFKLCNKIQFFTKGGEKFVTFFDVLKDKEVTVKCNKCGKQFLSKLKYFISNQTLSCPYCRNQIKNKLPEEIYI